MRFTGIILSATALAISSASAAALQAPADFAAAFPSQPAGLHPADARPSAETSKARNAERIAFVAGLGIEAGFELGDSEGFLPLIYFDAGIVSHGIGLRGVYKSIYWINQGGGEIIVRLIKRESSYVSMYGGGGVFSTEDDRDWYAGLGIEYGRAFKKRLKGSFLCFQLGGDIRFDSGEEAAPIIYAAAALRHRWSFASRDPISKSQDRIEKSHRVHIRAGLGVPDLLSAGLGFRFHDVWHIEARAGLIPVPDPPVSVVLEGYRMRDEKGFQHGPCAAGAVVLNWDGQGYYAGGGYRIQAGGGDVRLGAELLVYFRVAGLDWGLPVMPAPAVFLVWRP